MRKRKVYLTYNNFQYKLLEACDKDPNTAIELLDDNNSQQYINEIINDKINENFTLLMVAINNNETQLVAKLLEEKADPNKWDYEEDDEGCTPLDIAIENENLDIIKLLIKYKANPDTCLYGFTSLQKICETNNFKLFKEYSILTNDYNYKGCIELTIDLDIIKTIIKQNKHYLNEKVTYTDQTVLHNACLDGYVDKAQYLINRGANLKKVDDKGYSALHILCEEADDDNEMKENYMEILAYMLSWIDLQELSGGIEYEESEEENEDS